MKFIRILLGVAAVIVALATAATTALPTGARGVEGAANALHSRPGADQDANDRTTTAAKKKEVGMRCTKNTKIKKGRYIGTHYEWPNQHPWRITIEGPNQGFNRTYQATWSNKVSGTLGATYEGISSSVGFEVTKEFSEGLRHNFEAPKKAIYRSQVGRVYKGYKFHVWKDVGKYAIGPNKGIVICRITKKNAYQGAATAYRFWQLYFKCTYRKNGKTRNCSA